ncbi:single-stranded DNA-binding protein [Pelagibius sp. Alg239-R121]|uniref:single-stranded DNA-binding protein n=1 Tax=Pelagibius sp. Alg239-R121 TaxID=2993448 RepID=UPI0024A6EBE8|nr:single-stranded DNA-binding protein [Pelagibius sp. Alg239-R121]
MQAEFTIIGRIGKIFDRREDDSPVAFGISVATERSWKDENGWQKRTFWHYVTVPAGLARLAEKLRVGDLIQIRGDLRPWSQSSTETESEKRGIDLIMTERKILVRASKEDTEQASSEAA